MSVHIYVAPLQPATKFAIEVGGLRRHWVRNNPRTMVYCHMCGQRRWAKNCVVQVYYDSIRFWCREGHGCKA